MEEVSLRDLFPKPGSFSFSEKETFLTVGGILPEVVLKKRYEGMLSEAVAQQKVSSYENLNLEEIYRDLLHILESEVRQFTTALKGTLEGLIETFESFSRKYNIPVYVTVSDFLKIMAKQLMGYVEYDDGENGEGIARVCRQTKLVGDKTVTVCTRYFNYNTPTEIDIYVRVGGGTQ